MMHFKLVLLVLMVAVMVRFATVSGERSNGTVFSDESCHQTGSLVFYRIKLVTSWSKKLFPKHYPEFRPSPHWSITHGLTHNDSFRLFELKQPASEPVVTFAETGHAALLEESMALQQDNLFDEFRLAKIRRGKGENEATFFVDGKHSRVSFITKIVPSPDWFIGLDSFNLCSKGRWLEKITVPLHPLDAGSSSGLTFTSPKWPTIPRASVERITARYPLHFASSFFYPEIKHLPPIAHVTFTKMNEYLNHNNVHKKVKKLKYKQRTKLLRKLSQNSLVEDSAAFYLVPNETSTGKNCQVSAWSAWSPCSKTCGLGKRNRTRTVQRIESLGGLQCPSLIETQWCGSARQCSVINSYFRW